MFQLRTLFSFIIFFLLQQSVQAFEKVNEPDSVYLFSYATSKNQHTNGLHFAWSRNHTDWYEIGKEFSYPTAGKIPLAH